MPVLAALSASLGLWAQAAAAPAPAEAPAPNATAVPSTTAAPATFEEKQRTKLKCEKIVTIGSRMPTRVCRTPEQIKEVEAQARDTMTDFQKINPERIH